MRRSLPVLLVALSWAAHAQVFTDDYEAYAPGADGGPAWEPNSISFEAGDGAYWAESGESAWAAVPRASGVTFVCDVTPVEDAGRAADWRIAGIGIGDGFANCWALQLIAAPEAQGKRHYLELHESVNGAWLAESQTGTRLVSTVQQGGEFDWQWGATYRFELTLGEGQVSGRILSEDEVVGRFGFRLDGGVECIRSGRPFVRAANMRVRFDDARAEVVQVAQGPGEGVERPAAPPWQSRPGKPMAPGTGFFRTHEQDGRWWLLDPEGKPFFAVGTDHCRYTGHGCEALGYAPYGRNMEARYPNEADWAVAATDRLKAWGFNVLGAGHSSSTRYRGLAHVEFAAIGQRFAQIDWIAEPIHWTGFPDVFSEKWPRHCRLVARQVADTTRGDPWLLGTFLDNELEWYGKTGHLVDDVFALGPDDAAKRALLRWLKERYGGWDAVNRALGTAHADEEAFLGSTKLPEPSAELDTVRAEFLRVIAEAYFGEACRALREADPDHMVIGCRFAGRTPAEVLETAGRHNDIFTLNSYPYVDMDRGRVLGVPQQLCEYYDHVGKPMIITEWSFPALDSGLPCKAGAGMRVDTQEQKARCYEIFANMVADLPFMVGQHYFMWVDEPAQGISSTFPEDSNYGLVNERDEPYEAFVQRVAEVNPRLAERHARSIRSGEIELGLTAAGSVEATNASEHHARGTLLVSSGPKAHTIELDLSPSESRVVPGPGGRLAFARLTGWDGSTRDLIPPSESPWVLNVGTQELRDVPFVLEGDAPRPIVVPRIASGEAVAIADDAVAAAMETALDLTAAKGRFVHPEGSGSLFDVVEYEGLQLGRLVFALHQCVGGQHLWTEADAVEEMTVYRSSTGAVADFVVAFTGGGRPVTRVGEAGASESLRTAPARYRAGVRVAVPAERPVAMVRPLWVVSTDARPWELIDVFVFCRPAVGGSPENDQVVGPDVPMYYLGSVGACTDEVEGGAFGAVSRPGEWTVRFWKDEGGGIHPDACYPVGKTLEPEARWEAQATPWLWVFVGSDASVWRTLANECMACRDAVLAMP